MLAVIFLAGLSAAALAQSHSSRHGAAPLLFFGQADGRQLAPPGDSGATATVALIVGRDRTSLAYELTYQGLGRGAPGRIAIHNFGAGGNGATVAIVCGSGEARCPERTGARMAGGLRPTRWSNEMLSELISGRFYVQIDGGDGRPEIRAQLRPNGAMTATRNYVAHLRPRNEAGASGEGTAVLTETLLPDGRVGVQYSVTVAGTSGRPEAVALAAVQGPPAQAGAQFAKANALPVARGRARSSKDGGSFAGRYVARADRRGPPSALALDRGASDAAIVVRTSRFRRGELAGIFAPVE